MHSITFAGVREVWAVWAAPETSGIFRVFVFQARSEREREKERELPLPLSSPEIEEIVDGGEVIKARQTLGRTDLPWRKIKADVVNFSRLECVSFGAWISFSSLD